MARRLVPDLAQASAGAVPAARPRRKRPLATRSRLVVHTLPRQAASRLTLPLVAAGLVPVAYLCFFVGLALSLINLPRGFDYGSCVISRICSSYHNPNGYRYFTFAMIAMPLCLAPLSSWYPCCFRGCARLTAWARTMFRIGLAATACIGIERGFFPTHWTRYESIHLMLAAVAFLFWWVGLALFAAADGPPGMPRVRWRWLYRPPAYLAACVLPIVVVFGMYAPLIFLPGAHHQILEAWPRRLVFLRTPTFWQWYLVLGLGVSVLCMTGRALKCSPTPPVQFGLWRIHTGHVELEPVNIEHNTAESHSLTA